MSTEDISNKYDGNSIIRKIESAADILRSHGITELSIFGSAVRGEAHEGSDVDVLIDFTEDFETYENFLAVADLLEKLLGVRVDIVTRNGLSPHAAPYIEGEARSVKIA